MVQIFLLFSLFSVLLRCYECSVFNIDNELSSIFENPISRKQSDDGTNEEDKYITRSRNMQSSSDILTETISVRFSVQILDGANVTVENESDQIGQADDKLSEALFQTTTQYLCQDTTFIIVTRTQQNRDICESFKRVNELEQEGNGRNLQSRTKLLVDTLDAIADAKRVSSDIHSDIDWLEVGVQYEILEVSDQVILLSDQSVKRLSPIEIIERTAQLVTGNRIDEGDFGENLQKKDERVRRVASIGEEDDVFSRSNNPSPVKQKLVIKPMHGIRLAGIILMVITIMFVGLLFSAAKARNKELIWEQKRMEEGPGGLATIQGVDAMLEVGRMRAKRNDGNVFPKNAEIN